MRIGRTERKTKSQMIMKMIESVIENVIESMTEIGREQGKKTMVGMATKVTEKGKGIGMVVETITKAIERGTDLGIGTGKLKGPTGREDHQKEGADQMKKMITSMTM